MRLVEDGIMSESGKQRIKVEDTLIQYKIGVHALSQNYIVDFETVLETFTPINLLTPKDLAHKYTGSTERQEQGKSTKARVLAAGLTVWSFGLQRKMTCGLMDTRGKTQSS